MAKSTRGKRRSFRGLVRYLIILITGGSAGFGGWHFRDHPTIAHLLGVTNPDATPRDVVRQVIKTQIAKVTENVAFRKPGRFEVKVAKVVVDDGNFAQGHTLDLQARVLRVEKDDDPTLLWSSKQFGDRLAVVGRDELGAGWPLRPFVVDWRPGDIYIVEVWNFRGLRPRKLFEVVCDDRDAFPLRSGRVVPVPAKGRPAGPVAPGATANAVVFDAVPAPGDDGRVVAERPGRGVRR